MLQVENFSRGHALPLMLILIVGIILGWLGFILFGDSAANTEVVYVSAKEILKFEKERIAEIKKKKIQGLDYLKNSESVIEHVFYGHSGKALSIIEKLAASLNSKNTKVVFVSDSAVKGEMVSSCSKQLHARVLKVIKNDLVNQDKDDNRNKKDKGGEEHSGLKSYKAGNVNKESDRW